jgi:hypothetical protein
MTETYELENVIKELYKLEEMFGYEDEFVVTYRDPAQAKVHDLAFRLRIWKENNYDKLLEALNGWNEADRLFKGEIREIEPPIEDIMQKLSQRTKEMRGASRKKRARKKKKEIT